jgi:hypothetical protein
MPLWGDVGTRRLSPLAALRKPHREDVGERPDYELDRVSKSFARRNVHALSKVDPTLPEAGVVLSGKPQTGPG